jgi:hypothetical protein
MSDQEQTESVLAKVRQIKEADSEKEANAYLKTGWTLLRTFYTAGQDEMGHVNYVLGWCREYGKPKRPHIIRKPA